MKRIMLLLCLLPISAYSSDVNIKVNRPDSPGIYTNQNIRDRGDGTYAPTVNAEPNFSFSAIQTTATIKTTAGLIHTFTLASQCSGRQWKIYDSTHVAGISTLILNLPSTATIGTYLLDAQTANGIQINIAGASFAGCRATVTYR